MANTNFILTVDGGVCRGGRGGTHVDKSKQGGEA